ncbi:MAG: rod shape-determining protein MreC [Prevotella sp.]|nr:rod shape-determining protein MreC [Prevotella sp.]
MHNLIEFLTRYKHWFLFVMLEVVSLVLLFQFNNYQGSVWFTSANAVTGKVYELSSKIESYFGLSKVNQELTERNLYLERRVQLLSDKLKDKSADPDYLKNGQLEKLSGFRLIPAKVIDNSIDKADNFITLDKGSLDGVRKDMGVACGNGVVGIVYLVSSHYSVVIPVLNSKSNISCAIDGRDYFGYLHWRQGPSNLAYIDDIPRHAHFKLREKVVTSGYSSVFPPGVLVGEILHVFNSEDGLSYRLQVKLSTDFARLRDVCIIDDSTVSERMGIMQAAQDSIKPKQ